MKKWTQIEEECIRRLYPSGDVSGIVEITGRSEKAIKIKANRMGVYLPYPLIEYYQDIPIETRAYLAGHFDGEGCVRFRPKGRVYSPQLLVSVCNLPTVYLYKNFFNGGVAENIKKGAGKPISRWNTNSFTDIYNFCLSVIPFSIEKRDQLIIAKDHIEEWASIGNRTNPGDKFRESSVHRAKRCSFLKTL